MKKLVLLFTLIILSAFCFSACDGGTVEKQDYTVSFVLTCSAQDGLGDAQEVSCLYGGRSYVSPVTVKNGDKIADLGSVTCQDQDFEFDGWKWKGKTVTANTVFSEDFFGDSHEITLTVSVSSGWTDFR